MGCSPLGKTSDIQAFPKRGGEFETAFRFVRLVRVHPVVESRPLGVAGVQLIVGEFSGLRATPGLGGETAQHARPAAVGGCVAVGMQAWVEIGNRTPRANERGFRKSFERASEREAKMPARTSERDTASTRRRNPSSRAGQFPSEVAAPSLMRSEGSVSQEATISL